MMFRWNLVPKTKPLESQLLVGISTQTRLPQSNRKEPLTPVTSGKYCETDTSWDQKGNQKGRWKWTKNCRQLPRGRNFLPHWYLTASFGSFSLFPFWSQKVSVSWNLPLVTGLKGSLRLLWGNRFWVQITTSNWLSRGLRFLHQKCPFHGIYH